MAIIKVDGSCYQHLGHGGWAIQVYKGKFNYTESGHILTSNSLTAEKIALYQGIMASYLLRPEHTVIFTDCKPVIDHFKRPFYNHDEFDKEIVRALHWQTCAIVRWQPRSKIGIVHDLSKAAANER